MMAVGRVSRQDAVAQPRAPAMVGHAEYHVALGYLRAFATVLVVAHHSLLGYAQFTPVSAFGTEPQWWRGFPIVDAQRWSGFDLVLACNDVFLMSLMFFISGLFVWSSLRRKGS